ncbi:hypothetical protein [Streptomyces sp. cg35]|uniref:hypothetical protein n=1 Tax=Streptomyces sp. cg35 TaxID=3421650 RepID=UPI003D170D69
MSVDSADITAMREQGDLREYLLSLTGRAPKPESAAAPEPAAPDYEIAHRGGWPIGTAATGPTPTHGRCACIKCEQAAVVQLPTRQARNEEAA